MGRRATYSIGIRYSAFESDGKSKIAVTGYGHTTADNAEFGALVEVLYEGKVFSSGWLSVPMGDEMHESIETLTYIGGVFLDLPENPTSKVEIRIKSVMSSANLDDRVVNSGGFAVWGDFEWEKF